MATYVESRLGYKILLDTLYTMEELNNGIHNILLLFCLTVWGCIGPCDFWLVLKDNPDGSIISWHVLFCRYCLCKPSLQYCAQLVMSFAIMLTDFYLRVESYLCGCWKSLCSSLRPLPKFNFLTYWANGEWNWVIMWLLSNETLSFSVVALVVCVIL